MCSAKIPSNALQKTTLWDIKTPKCKAQEVLELEHKLIFYGVPCDSVVILLQVC